MTKRLLLIFQILVSVGLLVWIFQNRDMRDRLVVGLQGANLSWIGAGLGVALVYSVLGAVRWNIFLRLLGIRMRFVEVVQIYFVGMLFNMFLIGQMGGDAVKALILIGQGRGKAKSILSIVLDRISGLSALILMSWIFVQWRYDWLMEDKVVAGFIHFVIAYLVIASSVLVLSFVIAKLCLFVGSKSKPRLNQPPDPLPESRSKILGCLADYCIFVTKGRWSLAANGLSLLMLFGYYFVFYSAARAFGSPISFTELYALMPVVDILTSLPISVGGIGVREQLFIVLLGSLGKTPEATAVLISMCGFIMSMIWGVIGIFTLPFYKGEIRSGRQKAN